MSTIDLLPDEAEPDIVWALEALRERKQPQIAILDEFNRRLADRGLAKITKSSFSRWSLRKAWSFRRLDEVRAITGDIVSGLGTDGAEEVTIAAAEMIKVAVFELLEDGKLGPKGVMELSRALAAATGAQKSSADHRKKLEERQAAKVEQVVDRAVEVAREAGLGADAIERIRVGVLGQRQ